MCLDKAKGCFRLREARIHEYDWVLPLGEHISNGLRCRDVRVVFDICEPRNHDIPRLGLSAPRLNA